MYDLRSYQKDLIAKVIKSMKSGNRKIIVQSPPRTGKTVVMAEIARKTTIKGNRVMFIIHRKEVLEQAIETFKSQNVDSDLLTAGMVQTLTRRIDKIPEPRLILIDEAHHVLAKSYTRILDRFPNSYVLLFTATPVRTGRMQLDQIADDIIVGQSIKELTQQGFLAPFKYYSVPYKDINKSKLVKSSTGDYTKKSMDNALSSKIYGHAVDEYLEKCDGMQAVVYTYSVKSAKALANEFKSRNISAAEVDGETAKNERDQIVNQFRKGKIKVLVNVDLFTEGIDLPNVDAVIMTRPTESLSLYMQFSMRCLNPREGKTAVIIDQVSNYEKFDLPNSNRNWKELMITKAKRKSNNSNDYPIMTCPDCFAVFERNEIIDNCCPECGYAPLIQCEDKAVIEGKTVEIDQLKEEKRKHRLKILKELEKNVQSNVVGKSIKELRNYEEFKAYARLHGYPGSWVYMIWQKRKAGLL